MVENRIVDAIRSTEFPSPQNHQPLAKASEVCQPGLEKNTGQPFLQQIDPLMTRGWFWLNKPIVFVAILLMVQKSQGQPPGIYKPGKYWDKLPFPQLVNGFLNHQQLQQKIHSNTFPLPWHNHGSGEKKQCRRRKLGGTHFYWKNDYGRKSIYTLPKFNLVTKKKGVQCRLCRLHLKYRPFQKGNFIFEPPIFRCKAVSY